MKKFLAVTFIFLVLTAAVLAYRPIITEDAFGVFNNFEIGTFDDCYYYERLNETEKKAYTSIEAEIRDFPDFIRIPTLKQEELSNVLSAFLYDHPDIFYFDNCSVETAGNVSKFYAKYKISVEDYSAYSLQLKEKLLEITTKLEGASDYKKEIYIHDLLVDNCEYGNSEGYISETLVGALLKGEADCSGYAKAMKYLLNSVGVECILVTGTADNSVDEPESHMWNIAVIDGVPCHLDTTWDDPVDMPDSAPRCYIYFNMTDKMIARTHTNYAIDYKCESDSKYYYVVNGNYFSSSDSDARVKMAKLIAVAADKGKTEVEFMFDTAESYSAAVKALIDEEKIYRVLELADTEAKADIITNRLSYSAEGSNRIITIIIEIGD